MEAVIIGKLPEKNAYHRLCWCRQCGVIFLGDLDLEFRKFSSLDSNDGYYVCPKCGEELATEWVEVWRFVRDIKGVEEKWKN